MKRLAFVILTTMALVACEKESYRHGISVMRPYPGSYGVAYADQQVDSIIFSTFDSYRTSVNGASWLTIDPQMAAMEIPNTYWNMWEVVLPLTLTVNTTGETRDAVVSINTYGSDDWDQTAQVSYLQLGWLNVIRPIAGYESYSSTSFPRKAEFVLTDSATQVADSLAFKVNGDWTLDTSSSFIHLALASGKAGEHVVNLTMDANMSTSERVDTIKLTSNGVTTPIVLKQYGKKE